MKTSMLLLLLLAGCEENSGTLGRHCKPDGTCAGSLVCVKRFERLYYRSDGESLVYRCVLPKEVQGGPTN